MNPILQRDIQRDRASLSDFRALFESVPSTEDLSVSLNETFSVFKKSIEGSGAGITAQFHAERIFGHRLKVGDLPAHRHTLRRPHLDRGPAGRWATFYFAF